MVAIFRCADCKTPRVFGRFKGGEMNPPHAWCPKCFKRTTLLFETYREERLKDFDPRTGKGRIGEVVMRPPGVEA